MPRRREPLGQSHQEPATVAERVTAHVGALHGQKVEYHQKGGGLFGQHPHTALGRMNTVLQRIEVEPLVADDHHLAVDDRPGR